MRLPDDDSIEDPVYVVLLIDRTKLGRPVKMLAQGGWRGFRATASIHRALVCQTPSGIMERVAQAGTQWNPSSFVDRKTGNSYLMVVAQVERAATKAKVTG